VGDMPEERNLWKTPFGPGHAPSKTNKPLIPLRFGHPQIFQHLWKSPGGVLFSLPAPLGIRPQQGRGASEVTALTFRGYFRHAWGVVLIRGPGDGLHILSHLHGSIQHRPLLQLHPAGNDLSLNVAGGLHLQS